MGTTRRKCVNDRVVGTWPMCSLLIIILLIFSVLTMKTTSEAQNEVNVGSRIASGSKPVVGPAAGSTQSGTAHGGSTDPPIAGSAGGGAGGPDGK